MLDIFMFQCENLLQPRREHLGATSEWGDGGDRRDMYQA